MEKSMADQFLEQQQAAQEQQQQAEAEKTEAEKAKDRDYQPDQITPLQPEQEQSSRHIDLDTLDHRTETAKLDERQAAAMQNHLQDQMPDKSGAEIENIRSIGDAKVGKLSASQQREQEQEELER